MKEEVNKRAFDKFEQTKGKPKRDDVAAPSQRFNNGKSLLKNYVIIVYKHVICEKAFFDEAKLSSGHKTPLKECKDI